MPCCVLLYGAVASCCCMLLLSVPSHNCCPGAQQHLADFSTYKTSEKRAIVSKHLEMEANFNTLALRLTNHNRPAFVPANPEVWLILLACLWMHSYKLALYADSAFSPLLVGTGHLGCSYCCSSSQRGGGACPPRRAQPPNQAPAARSAPHGIVQYVDWALVAPLL